MGLGPRWLVAGSQNFCGLKSFNGPGMMDTPRTTLILSRKSREQYRIPPRWLVNLRLTQRVPILFSIDFSHVSKLPFPLLLLFPLPLPFRVSVFALGIWRDWAGDGDRRPLSRDADLDLDSN